MPEGKPSVLASLTAQVMTTSDEKKKAARKLTPVEGETAAEAPLWPTDLNVPGSGKGFMSHEAMRASAVDLRRHAASLIEIADALDIYTGDSTVPGGVVESIDEARKRKEAEGDAKAAERAAAKAADPDTEAFKADFEAKQKAAQEAVYGKPEADQPSEANEAEPERAVWKCPIHDKAGIEKKSPSSGRTFIGCPDCKAFAR